MLTVACVWVGDGAPYSEEWVQKLQASVARHLTVPHEFVCLTDRKSIEGVKVIRRQFDWPKYWAKLELFKPNRFSGQVLYLDLDVTLTGNIDHFVQPQESMVMLTDYFPFISNSTMMLWDADDPEYHELFNRMLGKSKEVMHKHRHRHHITPNFGDQEYIGDWLAEKGRPNLRFQELYPPEQFLEFSFLSKLNPVVAEESWSDDLRICYCLGTPKFNTQLDKKIVKENWKY